VPTSIREQLLSAIATAVGGEYGIPAPEDERDLPVCIVAEGEETASPDGYGYEVMEMPVAVARAAASTSSTDRDAMRAQAHDLLAQIRVDMFADETFGGLADGVEYTGGGIQSELGKIVFAEAQFLVRYHTVRGDPYTSD
jgi:hypothetical protein